MDVVLPQPCRISMLQVDKRRAFTWGAGCRNLVAERAPPTNVSRVHFPDPVSYVDWICCWFSFLGYSDFSPLLKNQHFQFEPGTHAHFWTSFCGPLGALWVKNYILLLFSLWSRQADAVLFRRRLHWLNLAALDFRSFICILPFF